MQELREPFERVVLALDGHEDAVGRRERVHGQGPSDGGQSMKTNEKRRLRVRERPAEVGLAALVPAEGSTAAPASSGRDGTR